jgi:hypothetical protein
MPLNSFKKWKICIMEVKDYGLVNSNKKKKRQTYGTLETNTQHASRILTYFYQVLDHLQKVEDYVSGLKRLKNYLVVLYISI